MTAPERKSVAERAVKDGDATRTLEEVVVETKRDRLFGIFADVVPWKKTVLWKNTTLKNKRQTCILYRVLTPAPWG